MNFCDYCDCENCKEGWPSYIKVKHAFTDEDKWICDVCYCYEMCKRKHDVSVPYNGPCDDKNCVHRPKIVSEWK